MGSPVYPTQAQLQQLRDSVVLGAPEVQEIKGGELSLTLPANGLAVIAIR
jgi:xylan 1,4-beta-xylosidase